VARAVVHGGRARRRWRRFSGGRRLVGLRGRWKCWGRSVKG
jgi:hypothetical protein